MTARALILACVLSVLGAAGCSWGEPLSPLTLPFTAANDLPPIPMPVFLSSDSLFIKSADEGTHLRSARTALLWSLLGTALPVAGSAPLVWRARGSPDGAAIILIGGLVIGPSLGHFYAARPGPAFAGIGIRALAGGAIVVGGLASTSEQGATSASNTIAAVGAIVGGASLVWDILRAPHSARVYNDKMGVRGVSILITPSISAAGPGLRATATF